MRSQPGESARLVAHVHAVPLLDVESLCLSGVDVER